MKTTMYFVRHASAQGWTGATGPPYLLLPDGALDGHDDPPLGRLGIRQAELTRDFLAVRPIDYVYTSPLRRARETAAIIGAPHGLTAVLVESLADASGAAALEELCARHAGYAFLVVAHDDVGRAYLTGLLGINAQRAGHFQLDNCGISVVIRDGAESTVSILNASFHLQGIAA